MPLERCNILLQGYGLLIIMSFSSKPAMHLDCKLKQSVFLLIQVSASSQTKGLVRACEARAVRACNALKT